MMLVLLGEPPRDEEHTFTPILKMIDFGLASEQGPNPTAQEINLLDIGDVRTLPYVPSYTAQTDMFYSLWLPLST